MDHAEDIIKSKFKLTQPIAHAIIFDFVSIEDPRLNYIEYVDIMKQLHSVDEIVLSQRLTAFQQSTVEDSDNETARCLDVYHDFKHTMQILNMPANEYVQKYTIDNIKKYDKHKCGYLDFLQFNNFLTDLVNENI